MSGKQASKLAFVTVEDARSRRSWSGTTYHMAQALSREGVALEYIGPLETSRLLRARALFQRRFGHAYLVDRDPRVLRSYARQVESRLAGLDADAILSPGTIAIAYLDTDRPIVTWTDATFAVMVDYYSSFSGLSRESIRAGHAMERQALARVDAAFYSSSWAAQSAVEDYAADPKKVHVVPFGANLEVEPSQSEVATLVEKRPRHECRLLFIGVDWFRKGGDLALAVASRLVESGIPTKLTVVGCQAPQRPGSHLVEGLGFLDKSTPSGEATITRLLGESHFLCLPSRADCTPVVFCEASAHGLPSVSVRTGGIESVLKHGANGYLFDQDGFVEDAAESIAHCMADFDGLYVPLANASYEEYRSRLNWATSAKAVVELLSRLVAERA